MKRFDAPYIRHQLHRLFVASMLAVAALALLGKAAHAQAETHGHAEVAASLPATGLGIPM